MIGKAKWFNQRKYGGWGLTPNCWQGWVYIAVVIAPMVIIQSVSISENIRTPLMIVWGMLLGAEIIDIMVHMKKDEREIIHEAMAERNAMWFMVAALGLGVTFEAATSAINRSIQIDPVILVALIGATLVKAATHWYLRDK